MIYTTKIYISLRYLRRPPPNHTYPRLQSVPSQHHHLVYEIKKPTRLLLGDIICPCPLNSSKTEGKRQGFVNFWISSTLETGLSPVARLTLTSPFALPARTRVGILLV